MQEEKGIDETFYNLSRSAVSKLSKKKKTWTQLL